MSIDQLDKIDIISTDKQGETVLYIADHFEWMEEEKHLLLLQDKINAYLQFIESGQIFEEYQAASTKISIAVVFQNDPPKTALPYLSRFKEIINELNFSFSWRTHNTNK